MKKIVVEDTMENKNKLGRSIQVLRESHMMTRGDLSQILGITRK